MKKIKNFLFVASSFLILFSCQNKTSENNLISSSTTSESNSVTPETNSTTNVNTSNSSETVSSKNSTKPNSLKEVTIAEFLKIKDTDNYYILTGIITNITSSTYGDFDLTDDTGSIYVYGLYENESSSNNKVFQSLNLNVNDKIQIASKYLNYNGSDEASESYFIKKFDNEVVTPSDDTNGYQTVDFTKAKNVKDVHDLAYYIDGCPTLGNVNVLVLPIEFSDCTAQSKGYSLQAIDTAFNGDKNSDLDYYSVSQYYKESSYGKLNLNFDVLDKWYKPSNPSSYYLSMPEESDPDQIIIDEILQTIEKEKDLSQYDSDNNGSIDAIVVINTLEIDSSENGNILQWAYRFWNEYSDKDGYYYTYDNVYANDYLWASYQFLLETDTGFNGTKPTNTYTFIHEFGHVLGAEDYYDTSYSSQTTSGPLDGYDIMDSMRGDHSPFTKFYYGWLTNSKLVTTSTSTTIEINDFTKSGDTIIFSNNYNDNLGLFQEYYILMYYTNNGLNSGTGNGYFSKEGIVMYHINATITTETEYGETYYMLKNNNDQAGEYYTKDNLIEYVKNNSSFVYSVNDTSSNNVKDDNNKKIPYVFKVNSLENGKASITFTKNN